MIARVDDGGFEVPFGHDFDERSGFNLSVAPAIAEFRRFSTWLLSAENLNE